MDLPPPPSKEPHGTEDTCSQGLAHAIFPGDRHGGNFSLNVYRQGTAGYGEMGRTHWPSHENMYQEMDLQGRMLPPPLPS